ncbi:MAG: MucR family transcriptional regulator [Caulobacteraceae bacterium]|nr:MucR family transcriptional regulator [Caulobacteraceae bacterium]
MKTNSDPRLVALTADIVAAYVSHNEAMANELPLLIHTVHRSLQTVERPARAPAPAVPIRNSIADDYLICLEDGRKFKSLKRHLRTEYDMSPEDYRAKWGLASTYPMVAPAYAATRSALAKQIGLGLTTRPAKTRERKA